SRLLTPGDAAQLRFLEAFGLLIANTDRHYGNISLLLKDDDWFLSPTYDMLPMLYAPINGEVVEQDFARRPLHPTAATLAEWAQAKDLAMVFWGAAAAQPLISNGFKAIAAQNLQVLQSF
ncbi:MAG: HipA domain-containing protein, partial [Polaromonas sp.]|nr:HipA domain-containing protein [Polaromonas sp.]